MCRSIVLFHDQWIWLLNVIIKEHLLFLHLILNLLLYSVLNLILLDLMQLHRVLYNFLYESASVMDLVAHLSKIQLHIIQLLGHVVDSIA